MADVKQLKKVLTEVVELSTANNVDVDKLSEARKQLTPLLKDEGLVAQVGAMAIEFANKSNRLMTNNINEIKKNLGGIKANGNRLAEVLNNLK